MRGTEMAMAARKAIVLLGLASFLMVHAYGEGGVQFGYSGPTGPDKWGSLSSEYQLCSTGTSQSPINIVKDEVVLNQKLQHLDRSYVNTNATLISTGTQVTLIFHTDVGSLAIDGKNYTLQTMNWHLPSEHTIDDERFAMELHLVHKSDDGKIAVVAILYNYGSTDPFLSQLNEQLGELAKEKRAADEESHIPVKTVNTRALKRRTHIYFRYVGSLTTPPCTEGVNWFILGKVREMSTDQAATLQASLAESNRNNSRPTQQLHGSIVEVYDESRLKADGKKSD